MADEQRVRIFERRDGGSVYTSNLALRADGAIHASHFDYGPAVEASRGGDHEHDVVIAAANVGRLAFHCLQERLNGESNLTGAVIALCRAAGIPFDETSWN